MILKIRLWCEEIIIATIISLIIEIIIPDGNNKKYIKIVIGIFIIYVSISPILKLFDNKFELDFMNEFNTVETYSENEIDVKNIYIVALKENIKKDLEEAFYEVENINLSFDINYEKIEKIELKVNKIKPNEINVSVNNTQDIYEEIKKMLNEKYFIEKENIFIN